MNSINRINDILVDLTNTSEKYAFKRFEIDSNKECWLKSNLGALKDSKIKDIAMDENLHISVDTDSQVYLAYNERTVRFSSIPDTMFDFLKGRTYKVEFNGEVTGDLNARVYVIGYNNNEKIQQSIIDLEKNSEIEIDINCSSFRIALRLVGHGTLKLNSIIFEPVKLEIVNKEIEFIDLSNYALTKVIDSVEQVKIAAILDEFSYSSFSKECEVITFTPYNYAEVLDANRPDFLLVESAWKGINGSWEFKIAKYNNQDKSQLYGLLNYCKSNGIPTVFWNKEDPIHYEKFIDTAKLFDHVFTTDRNIISQYKEACGHKNVHSLPFAAQVKTHNPISKYKRLSGVCFAGSYYGNRHEDRRKDMDNVLYACKQYNLTIYDRNYEMTKNDPTNPFRYPEEFMENVKGALPYSEIDKAYKGYEVMLNVNSVKDSPTMFSRRVFEGLASGTPIISTYSKGINEMFGDIIISDDDKELLLGKIDRLMTDKSYWKETSLKGIRRIMFNHTYDNRIRYILSKLSISIKNKIKKVSIISFVNNIDEVEEINKEFNTIQYQDKELIIIANKVFKECKDCFNRFNNDDTKFYLKEFITKNYNTISEIVSGDYVVFYDDKNIYGNEFITDLVAATNYTRADIIGKKSYYSVLVETKKSKKNKNRNNNSIKSVILNNNDYEYMFVDSLKCDRAMFKTKSLDVVSLNQVINMFDKNLDTKELFRLGFNMFSIDNYNFIENGKLINKDDKQISNLLV